MSGLQRLFQLLAPRRAEKLEHQTRRWDLRCPEGHRFDLWDMGGIRGGSTGNPRTYLHCPTCGTRRWMNVALKE